MATYVNDPRSIVVRKGDRVYHDGQWYLIKKRGCIFPEGAAPYMSRTSHGSKGPGYEYWSRRPGDGWYPGKFTKRVTAKAERQQAKEEIENERISSEPVICYLCHNLVDHEPGDECYYDYE